MNSKILTNIVPSQLFVYKNKATFDQRTTTEYGYLDLTELINYLGGPADKIVVVVPPLSMNEEDEPRPNKTRRITPSLIQSPQVNVQLFSLP